MTRRLLLAGLCASAFVLAMPGARPALAQNWDPQITPFDRVLGSADAPVTIIEYASFTCPHCAAFHNTVLPELKTRYIDTGRVRLVFRDFPLDGAALRAGMMARCAPEAQYFNIVGVLFKSQMQWATASDPLKALQQIGALAGISAEAFAACMANEQLGNDIVALRQSGQQTYEVDSTPTFIVNGEKVSGALPLEEFAALIEDAGA